ncbi:hypothetical protein ABZ770_32450 [Streptomyces sp. NPDC006654]|uniref:hypothetical protein n=1 Tax=Streptomyces sp. NPDC006654 TaxID=3156897 RepID=UPI0033FC63C1
MSKVKRAAVTAGAATLLAGAAVAGSAGSASAAVPHTFKVCAYGNYSAYADIPQQNGLATFVIAPGRCEQIPIADGSTYGNVWGLWNNNPSERFYVGTATFDAATGWTGAAEGSTTSPTLVNFH